MANYDSDSSGIDDVATNVLLGYASIEPTGDDFSQIGGHPTWLQPQAFPSGELAKCRVCSDLMSLLIQINADLPDRFPTHERRLYLWACRRKACRRKEGSVRGFRAVRQQPGSVATKMSSPKANDKPATASSPPSAPNHTPSTPLHLGEALFGVKPSPSASHQANPFATNASSTTASGNNSSANPFAQSSSNLGSQTRESSSSGPTAQLSTTFASKARISSPTNGTPETRATTPWPAQTAFPNPYPASHIDAEAEYIDAENDNSNTAATAAKLDLESGGSSGASDGDDKTAFESSMDKTFQRFADRLAQNPEQILRYEFGGQPLLYARDDRVGQLFAASQSAANAKVRIVAAVADPTSKIPRCTNCGGPRVFEAQLVPHAITVLEAEEVTVDGMDWGTILMGACAADCLPRGLDDGDVGYLEEWVGVQWEEMAKSK